MIILILLFACSGCENKYKDYPIHIDALQKEETADQIVALDVIYVVNEEAEDNFIYYYTTEDVYAVARVLYHECRGIKSDTEIACVVWTICNRVDAYGSNGILDVISKKCQFAYSEFAPIWDNLYDIAADVLMRWNNEKNGCRNVGRVLPSDYLWYHGDGAHNYFRNAYSTNYKIWDYSLPSPYDN